jgi:diadenosine tetraphosphate (Ap4A) HIT family hydrolase
MNKCPFCFGEHGDMDKERVIVENQFAYAVYSWYPVTEKHALIIPKMHEKDYLLLFDKELIACHKLLYHMASLISAEDKTVTGFNIGVNVGEDAGQTILHAHIHLIPRRKGDVEDPRGGVRHVIPGKGYY